MFLAKRPEEGAARSAAGGRVGQSDTVRGEARPLPGGPFAAWRDAVAWVQRHWKKDRRLRIAAALSFLVAAAAFANHLQTMGAPKPNADAGGIVGIGWIEPASRVVAVTGPADGGTVKELFVDQGSVIKAGDVLADLDGYDVHHADLAAAESAVHLAELQRQQVKSGAKDADIAAQRNAVAASEARVRRLRQQWERRSQVPIDTVVSREVLDASKADLEQAEHSLDQARNTLKSLSETRGIDEKVAEAQIAVAHAAMKRARAAADRLQIRAPTSGTVLSLQARKGEAIGVDGLLRMGDLSKLIVVAEIDGDLIGGISIGMPATLSGSVLKEEMQARVSRIANEIYRRKRPNSDILIGRDAKVLEVELETAAPLPPILGSEITVRFGAKPRPQ